MERATGVEPATSSLGSWHSTAELRPLGSKSRTLTDHCQITTPSVLSGLTVRDCVVVVEGAGQVNMVRLQGSRTET